jgi:hypothetical protein
MGPRHIIGVHHGGSGQHLAQAIRQRRLTAPTPAVDSENARPRWRISCRVDQRAGQDVKSLHPPKTDNRLTRPE